MSAASVLSDPYLVFTGWTLLVVLWATTSAVLLFAAWRAWHGRTPSDTDYRAAVSTLVAACAVALAVPFLLVVWPSAPPPVPRGNVPAAFLSLRGTASPAVSAPRDLTAPPPRGNGMSIPPDTIAAAAALLWIGGVAVLSLRLAGGWLLTQRLARRARPLENDEVLRLAAQAATRAGVRQPFEVRESEDVEAPVVLHWRRPVILVPAAALLRLDAEQTAALLVHEFTHVRRRDYLVNLTQCGIELLLFFSPAVVWLSRRIREVREFCCDDAAVALCGNATSYVHALTTLAALATANATHTVQGISGPRLITRVRRLIKEEPMPRFRLVRVAALAAVLFVLIVTGFQVSAASAARTPGRAAGASPMQAPVPFGWATAQEGSGVEIKHVSRNDANVFDGVTLQNVSNQPLTSVRLIAAVESRTATGVQSVRLFSSSDLPVSVAPGRSVEVAPAVPTVGQLQAVVADAPGARLQLFLALESVTFANGSSWKITPNPEARSGSEAVGIPRPVYARALIDRDASKTPSPFQPCGDDRGRGTSHGGVVAILNEPGSFMRCTDGRWLEGR